MRLSQNLNLINKTQYVRLIALIFLVEGLTMLLPVPVAFLNKETGCLLAFLIISLSSIIFGYTVRKMVKSNPSRMRSRDGYLFIITSMLLAILLGAAPFFFSGNGYSLPDSWFESAAGWTTTGAFVIPKDRLPMSLTLWKSELNFMGGFVMIFLTVSIFQKLGIGGQKSVAHDIPGANFEKLTVKVSDTARILIKIYVLLAVMEMLILMALGLSPFYAVCNSLSTMSTSGLMIPESLMTGYEMPATVKFVLTAFTILASLNFVFYFLISEKEYKAAFKNYEIKLYFALLAIATAISATALIIHGRYDTPIESFYNAFIQNISFASTSGFTFSDISSWPTISKMTLVILTIVGGCGFSTSSGIKVHRAAILWKIVTRGIYKRIHPRSLRPVIVSGKAVAADRAASITVLGLLYFAVLVVAAIVFSLEDLGIETSLSASLATITNNGTSFGILTGGYFGIFGWPLKLFATFVMIVGRLEMFAIFVLFSPTFWDTNRVTN